MHLSSLQTDVAPLSSDDYTIMEDCIRVLAPFYQATVEMTAEKTISGSKVIPMTKMLTHNLYEVIGNTPNTAKTLGENLLRLMTKNFDNLENQTRRAPTLLHYWTLGSKP